VIGEIAALRDYRHEYSVRASAKTELLYLPRTAFAQKA
jgi:ATP-binding cassette, subfamily B, bacterial HlyB/CyaB